MPETLEKLRPDRDLQCYYFDQSAIAALSETSPNGFTVSGTWRQQFDWCVVEWNRDNVFEHPAFRNLPDGDLSGLTLTYEETRENCIPLDSFLAETIDWPYLRVWAGDNGSEQVYFVPLHDSNARVDGPAIDHAVPVEGSYTSAYADFTLSGSVTPGQHVGLGYAGPSGARLEFPYPVVLDDGLGDVVKKIAKSMNDYQPSLIRGEVLDGTTTIRVSYTNADSTEDSVTGADGNRFGVYTFAEGDATWDSPGKTLRNGTSPTKWRVSIDFSNLQGYVKDESGFVMEGSARKLFPIPTCKVRKLRWTYAADQQPGAYVRSEFKVTISNWTVTGSGRTYSVAGPGSRRIEDNDASVVYNGAWHVEQGNYSGGTIRYTKHQNDSVTVTYVASGPHTLYVGTRYLKDGACALFEVDGVSAGCVNLLVPSEDALIRWPLGTYGSGTHTVTMKHHGPNCNLMYFDFIELAVPATELPTFPDIPGITLATDWDTLHSVAVAPERTAWMIRSLGFVGRQNHYVGALLFYETHNPDNRYASGTITFDGTPVARQTVGITLGPENGSVTISRAVQPGETIETVILSFLQEFNKGYSAFWAEATGNVLTIHARQLGCLGNTILISTSSSDSGFTMLCSSESLEGGHDGTWFTDLDATPRLNRAMRDWTRSFLTALHGYGIDAACAFSTELKHGDPSAAAGIAQRDSANNAIELPTPAIQTNFSPTSLAFWKQVHADCAGIMEEAGLTPFLQFGEEQWWYFPHDGLDLEHRHNFASMPYYDAWAKAEFEARYGRPMTVFLDSGNDPSDYPEEVEFLSGVLGEFTISVMEYVRESYSSARFEVLYPFDVNDTPFLKAINFPVAAWTPGALTSLKTEGLGLTFSKKLKESEQRMDIGVPLGFTSGQRSHLTGLGDYTAPWLKEARIALGKGFESVVLFALDQFCLIGYELPLRRSGRRTVRVRR